MLIEPLFKNNPNLHLFNYENYHSAVFFAHLFISSSLADQFWAASRVEFCHVPLDRAPGPLEDLRAPAGDPRVARRVRGDLAAGQLVVGALLCVTADDYSQLSIDVCAASEKLSLLSQPILLA